MLVKIDRNSITKNPRAGQTSSVMSGAIEATFEIEGKLPDFLIEEKNIWTTTTRFGAGNEYYEGIIIDPSDTDLRMKIIKAGGKVNMQKNNQVVHHPPEAAYLFKYENPLVICNNCNSSVLLSDITEEWNDEGSRYLQCPVCKEIDTFDIGYENIRDVVIA